MKPATVQKTVSCQPFLQISCTDCGHSKVWSEEDLAYHGIAPETAIDELGKHLFCSRCRAQGGLGYNLEIIPRWSRPVEPWLRRAG